MLKKFKILNLTPNTSEITVLRHTEDLKKFKFFKKNFQKKIYIKFNYINFLLILVQIGVLKENLSTPGEKILNSIIKIKYII